MKDVNWPLRKAYYTALTGITGVPVYYQSVPPDINPANYIVFRSINSNDASTKNSSDTYTSITVEIHTYQGGSVNAGLTADQIADEVFTRIYSIPQSVLDLDGMQMVSTRLANDVTQDFQMQGNRVYTNRFITFRHNIYVDAQMSLS